MASDLATKSKNELVAYAQRAKSAITRAKQETKEITRRSVGVGLTAGSGYLVGALRNKYGEGEQRKMLVPGTEIEADLALGVVASLAGAIGLADEYSDVLCQVGGGTLAAYLAIKGFESGFDLS